MKVFWRRTKHRTKENISVSGIQFNWLNRFRPGQLSERPALIRPYSNAVSFSLEYIHVAKLFTGKFARILCRRASRPR